MPLTPFRTASRAAILAGLLAVGVGACRDTSFGALPQPIPASSQWQETALPGTSYVVALPPTYRSRNAYGCFAASTSLVMYGPGWRDFCALLVSSEEAKLFDFDSITAGTRRAGPLCADCKTYRQIRTDTIRLGGRPAVVQRGLATGGIEGATDKREMFVHVPISSDSMAVFQCEAGGPADEAELLGIIATLRSVE